MKKIIVLLALALTGCKQAHQWDVWACADTGKAFYTRVTAGGDGEALIFDEKIENIRRFSAGKGWTFESKSDPGHVGHIVFKGDSATISAEDVTVDPPEIEWQFTCKHTAVVSL